VWRNSNDANVANGADTPIVFNQVIQDYEGFVKTNAALFSVVFIPKNAGGVYMLKGSLRLGAILAAGQVYASIQLTRGASVRAIGMGQMVAGNNQCQVTALDILYPGDQLRLYTVNRSGGIVTPATATRNTNTDYFPSLVGYRLNLPPTKKLL
jgi:hypothetical protein